MDCFLALVWTALQSLFHTAPIKVSAPITNGLNIFVGAKWRSRRKMLTPAFHFKILEQFQQIIDEKSKNVIKFIYEKIEDRQDVLEMYSVFAKSTLEIICGKYI